MQYYTVTTPLPSYIPYPRFLLDMPVNETARLVYSLILSRIHLSQANGWVDKQSRVYCRYTIHELMTDTGKSKTTIITALADLEVQGLLLRRRGGAGYANRLYIRVPDNSTAEGQQTAPQMTRKPAPNNRRNNTPNYTYKGGSL